jgi:hypothetical protein
MPTYQNAQVLNGIYYSDCLQSIIEQMETCMDYGLGLDMPKERGRLAIELDLDMLLRMDTATQISTLKEGVTGALFAPDEAREKLNLRPVKGGSQPYLQQQNYSLEALAQRDSAPPSPPIAPPATPQPTPEEQAEGARTLLAPLLTRLSEMSEATRLQIENLPKPPDIAPVLERVAALEKQEDPTAMLVEYLDRELIHAER